VCGRTTGSLGGPNSGLDDIWLAHYDGAGNQTWIRQFGTIDEDGATAVSPDETGGVYIGGWTYGDLGGPNAGGGYTDIWLAHYDGAGNQTWIRQIGVNNSQDSLYAATPDGSGGVYVSGDTEGSLGGPNAGVYWDVWLARYDELGNQLWIRQFGAFDWDFARAMAPDGAGGAYVSGSTLDSLGGPNAGSVDVWLAHYDGAGNQSWIRQIGTSETEGASAAAPDGSGGVFMSGTTDGSLGGPIVGSYDAWLAHYDGDFNLLRYCTPAIPNSTGQSGVLTATGNNEVQANDVTLIAMALPLNSFGFFLTSRDQGNTYPVSNSDGRLCLGGLIGRYVGTGQIKNSGATGSFSLALDLMAMAHPFNTVVAQPGQTWHFQAWHRDVNPGQTSNFTDAVSVTFR